MNSKYNIKTKSSVPDKVSSPTTFGLDKPKERCEGEFSWNEEKNLYTYNNKLLSPLTDLYSGSEDNEAQGNEESILKPLPLHIQKKIEKKEVKQKKEKKHSCWLSA